MFGAHGLDPTLIQGRVLLNLDSEDEGLFTVGCSGGSKRAITLPVTRTPGDGALLDVTVDGLKGGHSGIMIVTGRANACKVLSGLLDRLLQRFPVRLVSCQGGEKDNAIPSSAHAQLLVPLEQVSSIQAEAADYLAQVKQTYAEIDPDLNITVTDAGTASCPALDLPSTKGLTALLQALPCGVQAMMADIPGLPETSANLGVLSLKEDRAEVRLSVRSSVKRDCLALSQKVGEIATAHGADSQVSGAYPPWEYRKASPLRDVVARVYQETSGHPAQFNVIHAGLECGIFYEKFPGLDAVSFGPTILDIHSPKERFELASALRTWEFLLQLLAAL
jgi:dipeptidase D